MAEYHLESIMLIVDFRVDIDVAIEELSGTATADPTGNIAVTEFVAVMAVHEVVIHAQT
jgi:hypothetical protein